MVMVMAMLMVMVIFCDTFYDYLCHVSSMQGSVVRVGRVITGLDQPEEGVADHRVQTEVADETWQCRVGQM